MTAAGDRIQRFTLSDRSEHWVQMVAFVALAVTGLIQRYSQAWISEKLVDGLGGVETVRDIHRVFATILMIAVVYHYGGAFYRRYVQRQPRAMLPGRADLTAIRGSMRYVFGGKGQPPPQGRFTWEEKVEYWSLVWGTVLMIVTGYMLWNPIATTKFLPGQLVPAAKAAHGGEAVLALLAIVVWHTYHVHIRHTNMSMYSGKMSRHEMEEYHPLELAQIDAGGHTPPEGDELRRRVQRFATFYGISAVVLLGALYLFVTFEDTAIETIEPPEQIAVYAPIETLAPGTATTTGPNQTTTTFGQDSPGADATWHGQIAALLDPGCTVCHGSNIQSAGLDLSTYAGALAGGESGAAVVPGNAAGSTIVQIMEAGSHFEQLSDNELAGVRGWIDAGAEEGVPVSAPGAGAVDWDGVIAGMFDPSCTSCHGAGMQSGGLDLSSYAAAVAGGDGGAGVVPGDSAASVIYQIQEAGGHLGQLSAEDIAVLGAWIDAGAPETGGGGTPPTAAGVSWDGTVATLLDPACTGCHGAGLQSGGLDLSSYAAAVAGGAGGAGVVPGDSAASVLVQVQEAGGHPGQLSADDLAVLTEWIDAGAAESGGGGGTPPAAAGASWDGTVAVVFDPTCTGCHGAGLQSGGVDLSSYSAAVAVVAPGDAAGSVLVQVMEAGGHPGRLSDEQLALVKDWIDGGAAENDGGGTTSPPVASGTTWDGSLAGIFDPTCTACHGANLQSGGLDLSSYASAVAGGDGGAGVVPGDSAGSVLVQVMEAGGHPGRLSDKHLALVKEWIDAGASER